MGYSITWLIVFILFNSSISSSIQTNNQTNIAHLFTEDKCAQPIKCQYVPKDQVISQSEECCNNLTKTFECSWALDHNYLFRYFQTLKSWNCSENLKKECQYQTFALNDYSKNLYLSFCNHSKLKEKCFSKVKSVLRSKKNLTLSWRDAVSMIKTSELSKNEVLDPCVQVAISEISKPENFVEFLKINFVTCLIGWKGFNSETIENYEFKIMDLLSESCKSSLRGYIAFLFLIDIISLILNACVVAVIFITPTLRHAQFIYRFSIAVSDLMMSCLIFPSMINNVFQQVNWPLNIHNSTFKTSQKNNITLQFADEPIMFNKTYMNAFGVFTLTVIFVSIYTMVIAAWDRLFAISSPLKYRKLNGRLVAVRLSALAWLVALIVSIIPIFCEPYLYYEGKSKAIVSIRGRYASLLLGVFAFLPIPAMWVISFLTFWRTYKFSKKAKSIRSNTNNSVTSVELRLAKTLLLMVGAFTISILPLFILFIVDMFTPFNGLRVPRSFDFDYFGKYIVAEQICKILLLLNTMWNFFIYSARNPQFRKAFIIMISKIALKFGCTSYHKKIRDKYSIKKKKSIATTTSEL